MPPFTVYPRGIKMGPKNDLYENAQSNLIIVAQLWKQQTYFLDLFLKSIFYCRRIEGISAQGWDGPPQLPWRNGSAKGTDDTRSYASDLCHRSAVDLIPNLPSRCLSLSPQWSGSRSPETWSPTFPASVAAVFLTRWSESRLCVSPNSAFSDVTMLPWNLHGEGIYAIEAGQSYIRASHLSLHVSLERQLLNCCQHIMVWTYNFLPDAAALTTWVILPVWPLSSTHHCSPRNGLSTFSLFPGSASQSAGDSSLLLCQKPKRRTSLPHLLSECFMRWCSLFIVF